MITAKALQQLGFESQVDFRLYDNIDGNGPQMEWLSGQPQPSESEIATGQVGYDAEAYKRNRAAEYPPINDLIVALWENVVEERAASVIELEAKRQEIKAKYPK